MHRTSCDIVVGGESSRGFSGSGVGDAGARGVPIRCLTREVHGVANTDPLGKERIFGPDDTMVGRTTAGGYGHALQRSLAIGYVGTAYAAVGTRLTIDSLGERKPATVLIDSPYDPQNLELPACCRSSPPGLC